MGTRGKEEAGSAKWQNIWKESQEDGKSGGEVGCNKNKRETKGKSLSKGKSPTSAGEQTVKRGAISGGSELTGPGGVQAGLREPVTEWSWGGNCGPQSGCVDFCP